MAPDEHSLPALYMLWSGDTGSHTPGVAIPAGYSLRTYRRADGRPLGELLAQEGWTLGERDWADYRDRVLPAGLFVVTHRPDGMPVGTAGAVHNPAAGRYYFPFGGELAYLVVHPEHRGRGLGSLLTGLVVRRFHSAGYGCIRVGVQGFRLGAIKTYLRAGFVPFLHEDDLLPRWERICVLLRWPCTPEAWPRELKGESWGQ